MPLTTKMANAMSEYFCLPQSDWNDHMTLAAATAERRAIPSGAKFVRIGATANIAVKVGDLSVTAVFTGDVSDGSGSPLNVAGISLEPGQDNISVISDVACEVSLSYYKSVQA